MELVKLLLIRLKIILVYRLLCVITITHLVVALISVQSVSHQEYVNSRGYISAIEQGEYNKYYVNDTIIYSTNFYRVGSYISYSGECSNVDNRNFTNFSYKSYLLGINISCVLFDAKISVHDNVNKYYVIKDNLNDIVAKTDLYGFKQALVLGNKSQMDSKDKDLFYNLNLSHLLALSGMHISLIVLYINNICKRIIKTKENVKIVEVITVTIYSLLIFLSYSILRTLLIYYIALVLKVFKIKFTKFTILLLAFNILLFNNHAILSYSFIFSFFCYAVIVLLLPYRLSFLKIFIVIFLFTLPLSISLNNQINIIGVVTAPFVTLIFELVYFPYVVICTLSGINDTFTKYFIRFLDILYSRNFTIIVKELAWYIYFVYYIMLFHLVKRNNLKKYGYVMIAVVLIMFNFMLPRDKALLMFFDVGQGDAMLAILDDNTTILIDTGGHIYNEKRNEDIAKYTIIPYLKSQGISSIDYIILTHGDKDHVGSVDYLINNYDYDNLYINCNSIDEIEENLSASKITNLSISNTNYNFEFTCFPRKSENDSSIVTKATIYDYTFLSMGDLSSEYELQYAYDADILKVSHHGSSSSTSAEVVNIISPKYAIISVGNNSYGHPTDEVLNNLSQSTIYRTDIDCAIMFEISDEIDITTKCGG